MIFYYLKKTNDIPKGNTSHCYEIEFLGTDRKTANLKDYFTNFSMLYWSTPTGSVQAVEHFVCGSFKNLKKMFACFKCHLKTFVYFVRALQANCTSGMLPVCIEPTSMILNKYT